MASKDIEQNTFEQRQKILLYIARRIHKLDLDHPVRVAIDGLDTSGKTTFSDELVRPLTQIGRPVIRASVDISSLFFLLTSASMAV